MNSPLAPVALFAALCVSVASTVPLSHAGAPLVVVAIAGFLASLAGLAWVVISRDRAADPRRVLLLAAERFDERWPLFERDFWEHVAAGERG